VSRFDRLATEDELERDLGDWGLGFEPIQAIEPAQAIAPPVVSAPPAATVAELPAFSGMLRDRDPLALASWAERGEFAQAVARLGWSGPMTYETGEFVYNDVGESGQSVATAVRAARPEWVDFVRGNALEVMMRDLGWMAADVFLVANGRLIAQDSYRPSEFDRAMGTIVDVAAPIIIGAGLTAAVAPVIAAAELPAVASQVATRAATSTIFAAATDRPIDLENIARGAVMGTARGELLSAFGSAFEESAPTFEPLPEYEPVFEAIEVSPIEAIPLEFEQIAAEVLEPPSAVSFEQAPPFVLEELPPVVELPSVFEPLPVFEPPPVLEPPTLEPPPIPVSDPGELFPGFTDPGGKGAFGRLDIQELERLGATREQIIEVAQQFERQDLPVGPAAQRWIETGSFDPPPITAQEVPAMDDVFHFGMPSYGFEPPPMYEYEPPPIPVYEPPPVYDFEPPPIPVYEPQPMPMPVDEPMAPRVSFGGEEVLPTDLPPYQYGAPVAPDAPIPTVTYAPPAPTSRDWSFEQVITTVTRAADQAIKLVRAWETRKLPPNTVARATDAQGRTVLAKGDGMIYTRTPDGRVTPSRPAVGLPQTTVDGFVVVNNGDGTFTRITPSGGRETLRYAAAAPGGTAGAGAGVGLLVVAGLAAFALMG
jgi:hypothetical protein